MLENARKRRFIGLMIIAFGVWLGITVARNRQASRANIVACQSHLRDIGDGLQQYARAYGGQYPATFEDLLMVADLVPEAFICPNTNDQAGTQSTTRETARSVTLPGHCSYFYLGRGITEKTATRDIVIVYEPLSNHDGKGMNVLFADGSIAFVDVDKAQLILSQVKAGITPVRFKR